ncbi:FKBP-type peptidyl-prolyl cis-trans isomerase [Leadbetterella sp. DM7]|uniref:FKBP-type peptidyl-prolyl cis-trans isomerase n=1 Tax=Leadbetterella sp. DM7 TaxID=3235085 RepID=UPI00349ED56C
MKLTPQLLIAPLLLAGSLNVQGQELKTTNDSLSYAIGVDVATTFKKQNLAINAEVFARAIQATLADKPAMNPEQCNDFIRNYFMNESMRSAKENKDKGQAFLNKNKEVAGVVTLPSGLQYQVIKEGTGARPTLDDQVKVHYSGETLDGNEFDSSVKRGEPVVFGLTQVIKGWTEVLQLMPVGSKWKVFIPEDLAYGLQAPPVIGPNQTLVFEIELLNIVKE